MGQEFSTIDYISFILYIVLILGIALWVSREKKGHKKDSSDYFLAGKALPWWAIGTSLIASNISAEQFIGMSGSGYAIGLAIASYEWMSAAALLIIAKFFMPIFLNKKIYTMPQFLELRYDNRVRTVLSVLWLLLYIFVNLTSVLYLGSLALNTIMGIPLLYGILGLAIFAGLYSIYGGLKSVAWTDFIQVAFLIGGGLITTYVALSAVADQYGVSGPLAGLVEMFHQFPNKFDMILEKGQIMVPDGQGGTRDAFKDIPGISVLVGGLWIANFFYWGFNQYVIQKGLAAKNIKEAQRGLAFAGYLKLLVPLIVVVPGIAAYVLSSGDLSPSDKAYPFVLQLVPVGVRGIAFAALVAAIISTLAAILNSTSTIFTMDIYKHFINKDLSETNTVRMGRMASFTALVIGVVVARPLLGQLDQAFQFIQDFTGYITPGVVVIFIGGLLWRRATPNAALWIAILTIPFSLVIDTLLPGTPFMNRIGYVAVALAVVFVLISQFELKKAGKEAHEKGIQIYTGLFSTGNVFNVMAIGILAILAVLYIFLW
ncbi:MAG: sodium/sugar symporter [Bacteroidales bacterium]